MRSKISPTNKIITLGAILIIFILIGTVYLGLTYRRVDAVIDMNSPPIHDEIKSLHSGASFRVAVSSIISPIKSYGIYKDLAEKLAAEFGLPLEFIARDSYSEINDLLRSGYIDVAFVCSGGYSSAPDIMDVIAAQEVDGRSEYQAYIIVPSNSKVARLEDLKGRRFLFTDPESNSGYWYPAMRFKELGINWENFFSQVQWTGNHDKSIMAVAQLMSEGASVNSTVYNSLLRKDESLSRQIRILERSPPYPSPPVVVRKTMPISHRNRLVAILVGYSKTKHGARKLNELGIDGFVPAKNSDYSSIIPPEFPR